MKVSAVISPKIMKGNTFKYDKISLINFAVLASGLLFGSVIFILSKDYLTGEIWDFFVNFSVNFSSKTSIEIFSGILLSHLPYIFLMIIFGTSVLGSGLIALTGFIKTMGLGLISSYLYSTYGLKGIEYAILVFFPGKLILLFSMMFLMYVCISSSLNIKKALAGEMQREINSSDYFLKASVGVVLFVFASVADCLAIVCFSSLFTFT